ncbi:energy transducer TonB [Rheinheimera maricola]|uniref:Protein TonB n=1 Tax=Rheinheimera maricola TaxID=2793282 RepID=A0ABS7X3Y3_9GAMM|nr:energy transducer TonB [Rheinheimera maricola]MBZ9610269.1 TonB family protein [Rheinheimera maricola]
MPALRTAFTPLQPGVKFSSALLSATAITFLLFAAMQQLIKADGMQRPAAMSYKPVQLYDIPKDTPTNVRQPPPKMPEPQVRDLPKPQLLKEDLTQVGPDSIGIAPVELPANNGTMGRWEQGDRGATPLVRVEPRYPIAAARDGITGWVQLSFTIDKTGAVTQVEVLSAEPANVFNREAIRALKRWKYQPKIVNGEAINQPNMQVQLDFSLQAD